MKKPRSHMFYVRLSEQEKAAVVRMAEKLGVTGSQWVRSLIRVAAGLNKEGK